MKLVSLVLAAGAGRRFGGNKLVAEFRGTPLLTHAIRAARAAPVDRVIVVAAPWITTGIGNAGDGPGLPEVDVLRLESAELSASLKAGVAAAGEVDGLFVFLGDMPLIPHGLAARLAAALGQGYAAVPAFKGQMGHPVLLSVRALSDIEGLAGDAGAGRLLRARNDVVIVEVDDPSVLFDIDRPEDLSGLSYPGQSL